MIAAASRMIIGTIVGILFLVAMILAYAADLLDRQPRTTGHGITSWNS